jgi:hypothetical protein
MAEAFLPLMFIWTDEGTMRPLRPRAADAQYVIGERYMLDVREERSLRSHQHYFAVVREAWMNLPEHLAEKIPTPEHLRKFALIKAGLRDEETIVTSSDEEARKFAAFFRRRQDYSVVVIDGPTVTLYTAKSQSMRSMDKERFQASKDAVLGVLASLVGIEAGDLQRNAGQAA